ncbi:putative quinol monooxygenase [Streptomyces coffeae]|uniref:Antibiotic biosynthesis monooxygenase n=1 Tax=Streptomyces coffeae TaxID=621382 RepID=A0ABS1NI66_9ACTN|nr:putative quinol monooxygenase [Streptomyces coffeae]MBL1099476.1 antibiotic biosynthesis monooxygenase [Streptomyces coffeae]
MSNTLTIIADFTAKPGQEERLRTELNAMVELSLAEEGCLGYQPFTDAGRTDRMVIIEEWADSEALEHHFSLPHFKHVAAVLEEILAEPFTLRRLTDIPARVPPASAADRQMTKVD